MWLQNLPHYIIITCQFMRVIQEFHFYTHWYQFPIKFQIILAAFLFLMFVCLLVTLQKWIASMYFLQYFSIVFLKHLLHMSREVAHPCALQLCSFTPPWKPKLILSQAVACIVLFSVVCYGRVCLIMIFCHNWAATPVTSTICMYKQRSLKHCTPGDNANACSSTHTGIHSRCLWQAYQHFDLLRQPHFTVTCHVYTSFNLLCDRNATDPSFKRKVKPRSFCGGCYIYNLIYYSQRHW